MVDYPKVRAPDFPKGLQWLNTEHPLQLSDLRGKFVLLDFWTFCCINCMHVLPDLKRLEHKYPHELVVIGVHSAKFVNEGNTQSIRNAILRYQIEHPVVNDHEFAIWQHYAARAWPTLFLIDPQGYIVGKMSGEGIYGPFDQALQQLIPLFEAEGVLDRTPRDTFLEQDREPMRMLSFPGKISGDAVSRRLFITDTNHHRILVTDLDGQVVMTVGSGEEGFENGSLGEATFRQPQGTFFDAETETLYIADTENHAIRRADLRTGRVETVAGNGIQGRFGTATAEGADSSLNSPWDVLLHEGRLYVAMAGPHQIWVLDPETGSGEVFAGNGRENIVDGPRLEAELAQPSGLATDGVFLYFADSETSALRRVPFGDEQVAVETLVGEGLFEFGDVDGRYPTARLQHALGVAYADDVVYIADSYNHKVKRFFLKDRALTAFLGSGKQGYAEGLLAHAQFNEPGGLTVLDRKLFVADTNNHQIRVADLETGEVSTLTIAEKRPERVSDSVEVLAAEIVGPGSGALILNIDLPEGYTPNDLNTGFLAVSSDDALVALPATVEPQPITYPTSFPFRFSEGSTELGIEGMIYYCDKASGRCLLEPVSLRMPVHVMPGHAEYDVEIAISVSADKA